MILLNSFINLINNLISMKYNSSTLDHVNEDSPERLVEPTVDELQLEGLIQDFYSSDQMSARSSSDRKLAKMETITEEHDGSKLSVREILKRFEDLRTRNSQNEDKSGDRRLVSIQETLEKLDEKVNNYQVETFVSDLYTLIKLHSTWPSISLFYFKKKNCLKHRKFFFCLINSG